MEVLYRGFDGLDISFQGHIGHGFCRALEKSKEQAQKFRREEFLEWGDVGMLVSESGARGGYAFSVRTELPSAIWFFKKPNPSDPWGVRVSCNSFQLALYGFSQTKAHIHETLESWKIGVGVGGESISRVDYAIDFLAPQLALEPSNFVMHSNCRRAEHHSEFQLRAQGNSGRVTSVTVGKMPGRQIIVYDKRAEVIEKRKPGWFSIWDAAREKSRKPRLNYSDPKESRVWRVEARAGKKHLKERWAIRTWEDLNERLGDAFAHAFDAVRYAAPTSDSNRARWPNDALWDMARRQIGADLFEMRSFVEPGAVKLVQLDAYDQMLASQIRGLLISRAAANGIEAPELAQFAMANAKEIVSQIKSGEFDFERRLMISSGRVRVLYGR
ncbi:hypothetical protein [Qipengyuania seohaensis]|uniref:hypothetical protein n=1 Tax=Qipengyuania seohaensis TaxID=266951 RepID=UPI000C228AD9|nr:hypothetical protein [Qipengyuania seohaensis]